MIFESSITGEIAAGKKLCHVDPRGITFIRVGDRLDISPRRLLVTRYERGHNFISALLERVYTSKDVTGLLVNY